MSERKRLIIVLGCTALLLTLLVLVFLSSDNKKPHDSIWISGDIEFTQVNGVVSGDGSSQNPYVIEGWHIDAPSNGSGIYIRATDACFVVRDVIIHSDRTSWFGIYLEYVENGRFEHIRSTGNWNGIRMDYCANVSISNCDMSSNLYGGIEIMRSENISVIENKAVDNHSWNLYLESSGGCSVLMNEFGDGSVQIRSTTNSTLAKNVINPGHLHLWNCTGMTIEDYEDPVEFGP
jgi:parallel beta-helix repeat protein